MWRTQRGAKPGVAHVLVIHAYESGEHSTLAELGRRFDVVPGLSVHARYSGFGCGGALGAVIEKHFTQPCRQGAEWRIFD